MFWAETSHSESLSRYQDRRSIRGALYNNVKNIEFQILNWTNFFIDEFDTVSIFQAPNKYVTASWLETTYH